MHKIEKETKIEVVQVVNQTLILNFKLKREEVEEGLMIGFASVDVIILQEGSSVLNAANTRISAVCPLSMQGILRLRA